MKKLSNLEGACAPTALEYVSGKAPTTVLAACVSPGMNDDQWIAAAKKLGVSMREVAIEPQRLRTFLRKYPEGVYFVGTFDHLFVVDNGVIVDPRCSRPPGLGRVIKQAWKVLN